jgi:hypothetical protein
MDCSRNVNLRVPGSISWQVRAGFWHPRPQSVSNQLLTIQMYTRSYTLGAAANDGPVVSTGR